MSDQETPFEISPKAGHEHPDFSPLSGGEVEEIVVKLAKDGVQASVIGTRLRDQYAVPDVKAATGKTMLEILAENDLEPKVPEDLANLIHRALNLREHMREHPKDKHNMRGLQLVESRIRKVIKYYKRKEKLPYDWKYTERTAKLLVE